MEGEWLGLGSIEHWGDMSVAEALSLDGKLICRVDEGISLCCAQLRSESLKLAEMRVEGEGN